ncbi:hypothetical protein GCM10010278_74030 [Streptomyces melanogenes]|nr:hypothetical protein GCM10010278_74030 [Streptomyces melanogenes]
MRERMRQYRASQAGLIGNLPLADQVKQDAEGAPKTTRHDLAGSFNPLVVGSSPTWPTGSGRSHMASDLRLSAPPGFPGRGTSLWSEL